MFRGQIKVLINYDKNKEKKFNSLLIKIESWLYVQ
jgi:hypothetical protein